MNATNPKDIPIAQRLTLIRQSEEILQRQPNNVTARFNLAMLLKAHDRPMDAIQHLQKARKLAPDDLEITTLLAEICLEAEQYLLARKFARILCEKHPKNMSCRLFLGDVLEKMGKPDQAIKQFEHVLRHEPNHPDVLMRLSRAKIFAGNISGIQDTLDAIGEADSINPNAVYDSAFSRKHDSASYQELNGKIATALTLWDNPKIHQQLYFARGKIADDVGLHDIAIEAYQAGNSTYAFEKEKLDLNIFDNSKAVYTKTFLRERLRYGMNSDAPIMIFGMPRSGTTLVESICAAHTKITAGDELVHIVKMGKYFADEQSQVGPFRQALENLQPTEVIKLGEYYLEETAQLRASTPKFTDKMPHNFLRLGLIKMIFPNAPLIHVRRHPIDNCLSLFTNSMNDYHNEYKSDLTRLGLYYRQYLQLMQHWRENIPGGFHEVYYEDVVANTELNARRMIDYIGLDWEDSVLDRQKSQKSVKTLSAWQVRQPVYTSSAGRWKQYEKHLGPLIDALGPVVEEYENELKALAG